MTEHSKTLGGALLALALAAFATAALAQEPTPPEGAASAPSAEAAREALAKKEGDVDQSKLLKETLNATDKQYSLIHQGQIATTYDLTYSYTGQQQLDIGDQNGSPTLNSITTTRGHTLTNTLSADYGLADNLTANVTLPFVSRYSQEEKSSGLTNAFGDLALGVRFQPFALARGATTLTTTGTLRVPTGRSPFKTIQNSGLSTGAGYTSATVGVNASKIIDPVAIFGSLNLTLAAPAKHLNQVHANSTLLEVRPGPSIGFGAGFAYAMSYDISTSFSFQASVAARSKLTLMANDTGETTTSNTAGQTSASLNMGLGVRLSPLTTVNFSAGIGLTSDTPDFTFGMNMPLHF
jgi:opacity protein-like surface antigen